MRRILTGAWIVLLLSMITLPACAQVWIERTDAGELPRTAQITAGRGPLRFILGRIDSPADTDMFCIDITDPRTFSATTVGLFRTLDDTELFLFDKNGIGVAANDDTSATELGSTLPAGQSFVTTPGMYFIAISAFDRDPLSRSGFIFPNTKFAGAPVNNSGPGGADPVIKWSNSGFDFGFYTIGLTGASFCIPEPGSVTLLVSVLLVLIGIKRRQWSRSTNPFRIRDH